MKSVLLGVSVVCVCRSKEGEEKDGDVDCCAGMAFSEVGWGRTGENERFCSFLAKVTCWNSWWGGVVSAAL